jgi:hypothetical protein
VSATEGDADLRTLLETLDPKAGNRSPDSNVDSREVYAPTMGDYVPQYPRPDVHEKLASERQRDAQERARKDHVADEIHPPWWRRLGRALRGRRSSTPPAS